MDRAHYLSAVRRKLPIPYMCCKSACKADVQAVDESQRDMLSEHMDSSVASILPDDHPQLESTRTDVDHEIATQSQQQPRAAEVGNGDNANGNNESMTDNQPSIYAGDLQSIVEPMQVNESSINVSVQSQIVNEADEVQSKEFEIILRGTVKSRDMLIDKEGYKYSRHVQRGNNVYWRCCIRNKTVTCYARVTQKGEDFLKSSIPHSHGPIANQKLSSQILSTVCILFVHIRKILYY